MINRMGQGVRTPPPSKSHKNKGFPGNTGPDPLKNHTATKPAFNVGPSSPWHHRCAYRCIWLLSTSHQPRKNK